MAQTTKTEDSSSGIHDTLDVAIEYCVRALEAGNLQIDSIFNKFPQYESEIVEFLENWGEMESVAAQLGEQAEPETIEETIEFVPHRFANFQMLQEIGVGGMGKIFKAKDLSLDRIVAIKTIRSGKRDEARFQLEAEAAASLDHPNIVSIYEVGKHAGRPYISMQYVDGWNLKEYLDSHSIDLEMAARITETIARAVHHAHQRGVLHRDLKPANVLLDGEGRPLVTDFGLAKVLERDTELTQHGAVLGTPGYMSPEQASPDSKPLTMATDVYGLGALLYALLTGEAPFTGDSSLKVLRQVVEEQVASPRIKNKEVDRDLETICMKCLEKEPNARYKSADKLADDLNRFLNGVPVVARPATRSEKVWRWCKRNPVVAALAVSVAALLVATTVFASWFAYGERNLRLVSQENSQRESGLNKDLNIALDRATRERADLLMTNGLWQASNHIVGEALLWFSEAATLQVDDSKQLRNNLIRCQSWLREHPMPIAATQMDPDRSPNSTDGIEFQPEGVNVLYRNGARSVLWNPLQDDLWQVNHALDGLSSTAWSPDGKYLMLVSRKGVIAKADPVTREIETLHDLKTRALEVVFVNEGKWIAVSSRNRVKFLEATTGKSVGHDIVRNSTVRKLIVDKSGSRLAVINVNKQSSVYAVSDAKTNEQFKFQCVSVSVFDNQRPFWPNFIMDGRALLARVGETRVVTLDSESGKPLASVEMPTPTYCVGLSPDGKSMATGSHNYGLHFRFPEFARSQKSTSGPSADGLALRSTVRFPHDNIVLTAAIRNDGLVATGGWNNEVRLWKSQVFSPMNQRFEMAEKALPIVVLPHQTQIKQLAFSNDGSQLVTIQIDGLMRLWSMPKTGTSGYEFEVEAGGSLVKPVSTDRWLASGSSKWTSHMKDASVFRIEDGKVVGGIQGHTILAVGTLLDSAVSPDEQFVATVHAGASRSGSTFIKPNGDGGWLRIWDEQTGDLMGTPIPMPSEPRSVVWHPNGKRVVVCTALMEIVEVDVESGEILHVAELVPNARKSISREQVFPKNELNEQVEFSKDGKLLIAWSSCKPGWSVWDFEKRQLRFSRGTNAREPVGGLDFSSDGNSVAVAGGANPVATAFDLKTGKPVGPELEHAAAVYSCRFSPSGDRVVTASQDGHARVFAWPSGELLLENMTHGAGVVNAIFTPDSRFILTLGRDSQLRVWDAANGSLALRPSAVATGSVQILVSADSRFAVVGGGQIRVVDLGELYVDPEIDLEYARQVSELLSTKTIVDSVAVTLSSQEWLTRWRVLSGQFITLGNLHPR